MRGKAIKTAGGALVLAAGMAALALAVPIRAQTAPGTVRAGVEAWQRGDHAAAVEVWKPLAARGDADAAFNLAQAYRLGRGVASDLGRAQALLTQAANKGHVDAQTTLGLLQFDAGDITAGLGWLKKAAEAGEPRALLVYGTALFNGDGTPRNPVLAYAYVSRAVAQGLAPAKATLADMDAAMPLDQRKKGLAIAQSLVEPGKTPSVLADEAAARPLKTVEAAATPKPSARPAPAPAPAAAKPTPTPPRPAIAAKPAPAPSSAGGGWRIQLGAFGQRSGAEALYAKLRGSLGGKAASYVPAGAVVRLQVGPYASRAEAAAACTRLKGQACFPVAAK